MKSRPLAVPVCALAAVGVACHDNSAPVTTQVPVPVTPSSVPAVGATVTFNGLSGTACQGLFPSAPNCVVNAYVESGFTVTAISGGWIVRTDYGKPGPFIEFVAAPGATVTGELRVTSSSPFMFTSVDLYSSTTTIPYQVSGIRGGSAVFTLTGTMPNTFGDFATLAGPVPAAAIDTLSVAFTNPAAPCCPNPTGLDNIVLAR